MHRACKSMPSKKQAEFLQQFVEVWERYVSGASLASLENVFCPPPEPPSLKTEEYLSPLPYTRIARIRRISCPNCPNHYLSPLDFALTCRGRIQPPSSFLWQPCVRSSIYNASAAHMQRRCMCKVHSETGTEGGPLAAHRFLPQVFI